MTDKNDIIMNEALTQPNMTVECWAARDLTSLLTTRSLSCFIQPVSLHTNPIQPNLSQSNSYFPPPQPCLVRKKE
jgi:hypothetical protein